jgi:hypothetical protein
MTKQTMTPAFQRRLYAEGRRNGHDYHTPGGMYYTQGSYMRACRHTGCNAQMSVSYNQVEWSYGHDVPCPAAFLGWPQDHATYYERDSR